MHDNTSQETNIVSVSSLGNFAQSDSSSPSINSNAQFVAFSSEDDILVNDDTNDLQDIFAIDTQCRVSPVGVTPGDL